MKTIITYGTFDLFHVGHVRLLKRLKQLGNRLIVGVSSNEFNLLKNKKSFYSYEERAEIVLSCKYVDDVFPEHNWEQKKEDIIKYKADILGMGLDWEKKFDHLNDICEVIYLSRTQDISTTHIKNQLSLITPDQINELDASSNNIINIINSVKEGLKK